MKLLLIIFPLINALYTGSNINNAKDYPRIRPTKYNLTINRPLFYFTLSFGWMKDPNGCFYDKKVKVYHL
jgi:sucrose-6-phosphate hydrolase SacC (GH32 family)